MSRSPRWPPRRGTKATRGSISVVRSPATRCEVAEAPAVLPFERAAGRALAIINGKRALGLRNIEGRGGRCQGYALTLDRVPEISALAAERDGIAGGEGEPTDAAGTIIDATTLAGVCHLDAKNFLHNNDATSFFEAAGGLLVRGHSHQRP